MGIMVTKNEDKNDELTRRINADLREKRNKTSKQDGDKKDPDLVEDSDYVRDMKETQKYAWLWLICGIVGVVAIVIVAIYLLTQQR